jgi:hypothetical protein
MSLPRARVRDVRRQLVGWRAAASTLGVAILLAACASSGSHPIRGSGSPCPSGDPLRGVYHPERLRVLGTCVVYSGTVRETKPEGDGDHHLYVTPDPRSERYLDPTSRSYDDLVVEIVPGQRLPIPGPGTRVTFVGTWVYDTAHGWNEIHPVWSERIGGQRYVGLPPTVPEYGG